MNQYQANHGPGPDSGGPNGLYNLLRIVVLVVVFGLVLWLW